MIFGLSLSVYLLTAGGSLTTTDAVAMFDVTRAMVDEQSVAMSGNLLGQEAERGVDGRYYSPFGIAQSIYNIPFYVGAKAAAAAGLRLGKPDSLAKAFVALGETVLVAAIVRESFLFAVSLTGNVGASAAAALTLAFGSVLWPYSKFGFNQPLACFALLAAARRTWVGLRGASYLEPRPGLKVRPSIVGAGFWLGVALLTRHELMLAVIPFAVWVWVDGRLAMRDRIRRLAGLAPGVAAGLACWAAYNVARFGSLANAGQDAGPGFGSPIAGGVLGLLASPSTSIFLYSPVALAGVAGFGALMRRDRPAAICFASLVALFVLFYGQLGNWLGGRSYGSRYLLIVLPYAGVAWAAWLADVPSGVRRAAALAVFMMGMAVQLPGVLVDYAKVSQARGASARPYTTEERQWQWDAAPLVMNARALARALPENIDYVLGRRPVPSVTGAAGQADRSFSQQFAFSLDLWWLYVFYLGVLPAWALPLILATFAAAAGVFAASVVHAIGRTHDLAGTG